MICPINIPGKAIVFFVVLTITVFSIQAQPVSNVLLARVGNAIKISNGLLGIVIPSENAYEKGKPCPAPIQSFIYSDGSYSDDTFNELSAGGVLTGMKVKILENSSQQVIVKIEYTFNKNEFKYGSEAYPGGEAGPGFYYCTITVKKGEKTIIIEEDSDNDIQYFVKISNGLMPNVARYRGWSSIAIKYGYETPGKVYRPENERGYPLDATIDLDYSTSFSYPSLVLWEPAGGEQNSGRYWQVFNNKANPNSNLFGFFQGKPNRLMGGKFSGVQLQVYSKDKSPEKKEFADIKVFIQRRGPDNSWFPRKRFQWVAFISKKSDVRSPEQQQPIANELNKISGLGTVIKSYKLNPVKVVPAFYKGAVYMPEEQVAALYTKIKTDETFYKYICALESSGKPIFDAWRYPDSAKSLIKRLIDLGNNLQQIYETGEGTYSFALRYWMGTLQFKTYALYASCIFADKTIKLSNEEKKGLEQFIAMLARIVWDDNNVPLFEKSGVNFGPANMSFQYRNNGRIFFSLLLANDPEFSDRAKDALKKVNEDINQSIYENGSSFGSPHYTQATLDPILFSMLQLKQAGIADLFKTNPKVKQFARFYTTLITPPSVRFSGNRKLISFGDGSEESAATFALLATGLKNVDPDLSATLNYIFNNGPQRFTLSGLTSLAVDLTNKNTGKFTATTSNYCGYISHFRSGLNTENETAVWILNGDSLYDHRNDDAGEIAIYALNAPLSLSRSSFYYPSATDSRIRSVVVPEKKFPEWNQSAQPINERSLTNRTWPQSFLNSFVNLGIASSASISMKTKEGTLWNRKISSINLYNDLPIIIFYDSVSGNASNVWSMMMMSEGAIETPLGLVTPEKMLYNNNSSKQLPKSTPQKTLKNGLNKFVFTGQKWIAHPSKGINWNLYAVSKTQTDFTMAEWATTWQNDIEVLEFLKTNKSQYFEDQQIIRLRSDKPFFNFVLPYAKGTNPYSDQNVRYLGNNIVELAQHNMQIVINPFYYCGEDADRVVLGLLSENGECNYEGFSISGGYIELEYKEDIVKIRIHGNAGTRKVKLPFQVSTALNQKEVEVNNIGTQECIVNIKYTSGSLDLPNGSSGYIKYSFNKRREK
ncbi:MAG: hypothetical protein IT249_04485 [Chitinophagaceae bacterium]|nr:hypothetical protein [Chitinophagaceae bacterium]